ncbi:glycosyltransferase 52 family protein [Vibrio splendidus]|uniref:glycosyltransferase 52 family protein n=1 Tax=Vibrio splendidus TaxID=29497 RepID=UPI001FB53926|nr:glycosyltransferase 52 family protein [Vibrio splendidus]UOE85870.1 glycosyltransferase 52 family protein [Vibrio splendidus]UOE88689.1 glycosyltransferase 52 family protein [Vibrio splendidus]
MNIYIVTSPFQYICANEARLTYKTKNNILILVNQVSEPGITQQKKIVKLKDWDHIISISRESRTTKIPYVIKKIRKITNNSKIEHIFHGEYKSWRTKLIIRNLPIEKEVYFDDGTLTINEYEESIRTKEVYYRPRFFQDFIIKILGCKPIGKIYQSKNLEIFTIFDIPHPEHKIKRNNLFSLKEKYNSESLFNKDAPIGFIGQGAIGHKRRKTIDAYISELKYFIERHNKPIIYFPHRTESDELKNRISQMQQVSYHVSELPLEMEILENQIHLSGLVGILSTAQYTALMLYPNMPIYNLHNEYDESFQLTDLVSKREQRIYDLFSKSTIINIDVKKSGN